MKPTCQTLSQFRDSLRRKMWALYNVPVSTLAEITAAADTAADRRKQCEELRALLGKPAGKLPPCSPATIPGWILPCEITTARKAGFRPIMRGDDATFQSCRGKSCHVYCPGRSVKTGRKWRTIHKATNDNYVRSFCFSPPDEPQLLFVALHDTEKLLALPNEYEWQKDANGVKIVRLADGADFHITQEILLTGISAMLAELERNATIRREAAARLPADMRTAELFRRDLATTRVTLQDSRRAGNCVEGTLAFVERKLGIAREDAVRSGYAIPAAMILRFANGDKDRAERACRAAWERETLVAI